MAISFSCNSQKNAKSTSDIIPTKVEATQYVFSYTMDSPSQTTELPDNLTEISGISIDENGVLYAVQDEVGSIFKKVEDGFVETPFRKEGDYEGIEVVDSNVYVVKSSGIVYKVSQLGTPEHRPRLRRGRTRWTALFFDGLCRRRKPDHGAERHRGLLRSLASSDGARWRPWRAGRSSTSRRSPRPPRPPSRPRPRSRPASSTTRSSSSPTSSAGRSRLCATA